MGQAATRRIKHCLMASVVLLAHIALVWIVLQLRAPIRNAELGEPVIVTLIDPSHPQKVTVGPVPIRVKTQDVLHLQTLIARTPDISVDISEPMPTTTVETVPLAASAPPMAQQEEAGLAGDAFESGGHTLTLLKRVIPRYPETSAGLEEQGNTGVRICVDESGRVTQVKVTRSSGSRRLDGAAIAAVRKWKFAPSSAGSAPDGTWVQTELRFILYRFTYSRIGDTAAERVYAEQVKSGDKDEPTPGSQEAFTRFIADVRAGNFTGDADVSAREEVAKMRAALEEWGEVQSIQFIGTAGSRRWMAYEVSPESSARSAHPRVEVSWNMFEVRHQHATSAWLIAVDRDGTIWNARASPAPWL